MGISRATVNVWVLGVLTFFVYMALEPLVTEEYQGILSGVATAVYLLVGLWTFDVGFPARKREPERPSAVRARVEAARARSQR